MGLEDIAMFGAVPDSVILQPADGPSTAKLVGEMVTHHGFVYMRTLRPKTKVLYESDEEIKIGGSKILKQSKDDVLTIAATGITVFEALKAAEQLQKKNIQVRVMDCYSINPIDKDTLTKNLDETKQKTIITVEDHYEHGGLGDYVLAAVNNTNSNVVKMAITHISQSGKQEELLKDAGIDASAIISKVKELLL